MTRWTSILLFTLVLGACSDVENERTGAVQQKAITDSIFSTAVTQFNVKVFYEMGSEPYTGALGIRDVWDVTEESFESLFQNHAGRTIAVPHVLADMTSFPQQNRTNWNLTQLLELAYRFNVEFSSGTEITIPVIVVSGTYESSTTILGVHVTGQPFAFVFKDAIEAVGGTALEQRYVEQATVVHELGHAVGLVNNGLPMVANHEDPARAHHSTNSDCVMHWSVDTSTDVLSAINDFVISNSSNLFGAESLQDGRAHLPN